MEVRVAFSLTCAGSGIPGTELYANYGTLQLLRFLLPGKDSDLLIYSQI